MTELKNKYWIRESKDKYKYEYNHFSNHSYTIYLIIKKKIADYEKKIFEFNIDYKPYYTM